MQPNRFALFVALLIFAAGPHTATAATCSLSGTLDFFPDRSGGAPIFLVQEDLQSQALVHCEGATLNSCGNCQGQSTLTTLGVRNSVANGAELVAQSVRCPVPQSPDRNSCRFDGAFEVDAFGKYTVTEVGTDLPFWLTCPPELAGDCTLCQDGFASIRAMVETVDGVNFFTIFSIDC